MNVTRDEAAEALDAIGKAGDKVVRLKGYHHGAPHFILWGLVWLVANSVTQFRPDLANWAWGIGIAAGMVLSTVIGFGQARLFKTGAPSLIDRRVGQRIGMTSGVVLLMIVVLLWLAQPETSRQANAMISIVFPFLYMAGGIWAGWRLFAIGFVTAAGILFGYVYVKEYFELWMGVFAGGALIAGGIWLRTA